MPAVVEGKNAQLVWPVSSSAGPSGGGGIAAYRAAFSPSYAHHLATCRATIISAMSKRVSATGGAWRERRASARVFLLNHRHAQHSGVLVLRVGPAATANRR